MYLMGVSSVLIGLLPTYEAIGHWAPILLILLRFLQGIGVGGEWGGAILLALEWSSKKQQGLLASLPQMGVSIGLLLSSSAISLAILISGDNFYTWGWRLPFLLSVFLIILGFIIRSDIPEPPSFKKAKNNQEVSKFPVLKVLKDHPKDVLLSAFIRLSENGPFTIYTILMVNYATENFNIESSFLVNSNLFASLLMIVLIPSFGYLSDRYGIKKIYMVGIGLTLIWSVPYVSLVNTQIPLIILLATLISMIPHSMQVAPQGALMANSFPIYLRYSGLALGSQLGAIISGGIAPLLTMLLLHQFNSIYIISAYIFFASLVSLIATYLMKDINENSKSNYTLLNKMEETK